MPIFFKTTFAGVTGKTGKDRIIKFDAPESELKRIHSVEELTEQVLVVAVYTEKEFLALEEGTR